MKKIIPFVLVLICLASCSKEKKTNLTITGHIDGLKEGTLYLQQLKHDTAVVSIDSMVAQGDGHFAFKTTIAEPEVFYLSLDLSGDEHDQILRFFAEKGNMTINTHLNSFSQQVKITGSENQKLLEKYLSTLNKLSAKNNALIQKSASTTKDDKVLFQKIQNSYKQLMRSKYLFTINFALNHNDKEIAPYLTVHEIFDTQTSFLDTIYNSLTPKIQKSIYGQDLKALLKKRQEEEKTPQQ